MWLCRVQNLKNGFMLLRFGYIVAVEQYFSYTAESFKCKRPI